MDSSSDSRARTCVRRAAATGIGAAACRRSRWTRAQVSACRYRRADFKRMTIWGRRGSGQPNRKGFRCQST